MDRNGKKIGVKKSTVTVPAPSNQLSMSDVVVVRRTDALKDNQILDAFYFPGGKVVPRLPTRSRAGLEIFCLSTLRCTRITRQGRSQAHDVLL